MSDPTALTDSRLTLPDGRAIGWAEYGDPAGYPVIYVHGWPGSRHQGARLDIAGWVTGARIIAPERPGYGISTIRAGWTLLDWPDDLAALVDVLGIERFAIFGASGGGPHALACAARLPTRVTSVALASSLAPPDAPGLSPAISRPRRALLAVLGRTRVPVAFGARLAARRILADPEEFLRLVNRALPPRDRTIVFQPEIRAIAARDIGAALADGGRAAAWEFGLLARPWGFRLEDIAPPVRLWFGGMDPLVPPAMGHYLARVLPRASARYLPNEGHYLMIPHATEIVGRLAPGARPPSR